MSHDGWEWLRVASIGLVGFLCMIRSVYVYVFNVLYNRVPGQCAKPVSTDPTRTSTVSNSSKATIARVDHRQLGNDDDTRS